MVFKRALIEIGNSLGVTVPYRIIKGKGYQLGQEITLYEETEVLNLISDMEKLHKTNDQMQRKITKLQKKGVTNGHK